MSLVRSTVCLAVVLASCAVFATRAQEMPPAPADVGVLGAAEPLLVTDYHVDVLREGPAYQASTQMVLRNPRSATVEGVGLVPVPDGAIVRGFIAENGEIRMKGVVRSRDRAIDVYRGITRAPRPGKDPAVLEWLGDRWMRATVSPVAASRQVRLTVGFLGFTEKIGDRRAIDLPSDRTAYRGAWAGTSRRLLPGEWSSGPLATWCFRAPGADGSFCLELDPSQLLEQPISHATYLLVLETPESTNEEIAAAGAAALDEVAKQLDPSDSIELFANGCESGLFGGPTAADVAARDRTMATLRTIEPGGWGHLEQKLEAAIAAAEGRGGPVRIVVASAQRRIPRADELTAAIERARVQAGDGFALFTCALGTRADAAGLAELANAGSGRAFSILAREETSVIAAPLAAAARRPVLSAPRATVAGASELLIETKSHVTYGETIRICGRYAEGVTALVRLEGHVLDRDVDAIWPAQLDDENVAHPWVATMWAGLRERELRRASDDGNVAYLVRLAERFSLIVPRTVALGLEPALENQLPPLMGTPSTPVAQLDPPERPTPPARPETEPTDRPDRRPPPAGPLGPNGPTLGRPPPSMPGPAAPNPGPAAPAPSIPGSHGGHGH